VSFLYIVIDDVSVAVQHSYYHVNHWPNPKFYPFQSKLIRTNWYMYCLKMFIFQTELKCKPLKKFISNGVKIEALYIWHKAWDKL
jgi:hypothetical protein